MGSLHFIQAVRVTTPPERCNVTEIDSVALPAAISAHRAPVVTSARNGTHQHACAFHALQSPAVAWWICPAPLDNAPSLFAFKTAIFINLLCCSTLTFAEWLLCTRVTLCDLQRTDLTIYCFNLLSMFRTLLSMNSLQERKSWRWSFSGFFFVFKFVSSCARGSWNTQLTKNKTFSKFLLILFIFIVLFFKKEFAAINTEWNNQCFPPHHTAVECVFLTE